MRPSFRLEPLGGWWSCSVLGSPGEQQVLRQKCLQASGHQMLMSGSSAKRDI